MQENPVADADVPARIAIAQHVTHALQAAEEEDQREQECDVREGRHEAEDRVGLRLLHGLLYQDRLIRKERIGWASEQHTGVATSAISDQRASNHLQG